MLRLSVVEVDAIERPPSGKYQDFTSDFVPTLGAGEDEPEPRQGGGEGDPE